MGTKFATIYNHFLGQITDDMYMELTPQDTIKDMQRLLINALPGFEFPRENLYDYNLSVVTMREDEIVEDDFVLGVVWGEIPEDNDEVPLVYVDQSSFTAELTAEEIDILAILMRIGWVQRQVTSIEHTRMKFSGSDFKMTSQANHLSKLLSLLSESQRQSLHAQRLYKRRRINKKTGKYRSNWDWVRKKSVFNYDQV